MVNIGIVGTRSRDTQLDYHCIRDAFIQLVERLHLHLNDIDIISGGCSNGGDRFAEIIAKEYSILAVIHLPDWDRFGKSAGAIRNKKIAEESDYLIACVSEDRTGGTEITINEFIKRKGTDKLIIV